MALECPFISPVRRRERGDKHRPDAEPVDDEGADADREEGGQWHEGRRTQEGEGDDDEEGADGVDEGGPAHAIAEQTEEGRGQGVAAAVHDEHQA